MPQPYGNGTDELHVNRGSSGAPPPREQYHHQRIPDKIGVAVTDNELQIEQGIPIPMANRGYRGTRLPLEKMQAKDSVFVPLGYNGREDLDRLTRWVRTQLQNFKKKSGYENWRFVTKQLQNGVRFWRIT